MLKFFRKIRQQLISENQFSKYLLYAIGEIFLVMVGILLALQVNNWNQNRLNSIKELAYLERLQYDLQADTAMLAEFIKAVEYKSRFLKSILKEDLTKFHHLKGLTHDIFISRFSSPPVSTDNTFQEMKSTGSLGLLKDESLKKSIFNYYRYIQNRTLALQTQFSDWPKIISQMIPGEGQIFDVSALVNTRPVFPKTEETALIQKLLNNREVLAPHINAELQYASKQHVSFFELQVYANDLLLKLNKAVENRKK